MMQGVLSENSQIIELTTEEISDVSGGNPAVAIVIIALIAWYFLHP